MTPVGIKNPKPLAERVREAVQVRQKLDELGVGVDDPQGRRLVDVLNDFVRGHGFTGTLPLDSCGRVAVVKLSLRENVVSKVVLQVRQARQARE